ncbi:hypothetical protein F4703DRAFT_1901382 [Phycomyces blakesleeanus]
MKNFSKLQRIYSGIKSLDYLDPYTAHQGFYIINWGSWKLLSRLRMEFEYSVPVIFEKLFTKLSELPSLTHLTLEAVSGYPGYDDEQTISWQDIDCLHNTLPQLEFLKCTYTFEPISRNDIDKIKHVTPVHALTSMHHKHDYVDASWIFYLALKLPNLIHIEFEDGLKDDHMDPMSYNQKHYLEDIKLLATLDQFFPRLQSAVTFTGSQNGWPFSIFYDTLQHFGVKISNVRVYDCRFPGGPLDGHDRCMRPISESLQISWQELTFSHFHIPITTNFLSYPNLVELRMESRYDIEIDIVIDKCPVLKVLNLYNSKICLSRLPLYRLSEHPLKKLRLIRCETNAHVLKYVSVCCKTLSILKLSSVQLYGLRFKKTGQLVLDMPFTQLNTLILFSIQLNCSPVKSFAIEQLDNVGTDQSNSSRKQQTTRSNWYHTSLIKTGKISKMSAWELGKRDIEYAEKYYQSFIRRKGYEKKFGNMGQYRGGYLQKRFWKRDLQLGTLVLRFKSVKNSFFDFGRFC